MAFMSVGAAIEVGGLLWKVFNRGKSATSVAKAATPAEAVQATVQSIHNSPDVAIVDVKSTWFNIDNLTRLVAFLAAGLSLFFGREVVSAQVQVAIVTCIAAIMPVYEAWRSRRRTSITKAAAVNVLQKPKS
jgi:hypothetical protein